MPIQMLVSQGAASWVRPYSAINAADRRGP